MLFFQEKRAALSFLKRSSWRPPGWLAGWLETGTNEEEEEEEWLAGWLIGWLAKTPKTTKIRPFTWGGSDHCQGRVFFNEPLRILMSRV